MVEPSPKHSFLSLSPPPSLPQDAKKEKALKEDNERRAAQLQAAREAEAAQFEQVKNMIEHKKKASATLKRRVEADMDAKRQQAAKEAQEEKERADRVLEQRRRDHEAEIAERHRQLAAAEVRARRFFVGNPIPG